MKIELPPELCEALEQRFVGTRFPDLNSLLKHVARELLDDTAVRMDEEERRLLEQRLRDLGYV